MKVATFGLFALALCVQAQDGLRAQGAPVEVDLVLVLAVDASGSVDRDEMALQRDGYVAALRHPDLARAIRAGRRGRIAVTYFEWAVRPIPNAAAPWTVIDGPETAAQLADAIAGLPLRPGDGTSISRALDLAVELIATAPVVTPRRVIDISGDGPNNMGPPIAAARDRAIAGGITINGLPMVMRPARDTSDIAGYYEDCVIGGDGAFLVAAIGPAELANAIRRKLLLEIGGTLVERTWRASRPVAPCDIGLGRAPFYPWLYDY